MCDFQERKKKTYMCLYTERGRGLIFSASCLRRPLAAEAAAAALVDAAAEENQSLPSINSPRLPPSAVGRRLDDKDKYLGWTEELLRPPAIGHACVLERGREREGEKMRACDESWVPEEAETLKSNSKSEKKKPLQLHVDSEAGRRWRTRRCLPLCEAFLTFNSEIAHVSSQWAELRSSSSHENSKCSWLFWDVTEATATFPQFLSNTSTHLHTHTCFCTFLSLLAVTLAGLGV